MHRMLLGLLFITKKNTSEFNRDTNIALTNKQATDISLHPHSKLSCVCISEKGITHYATGQSFHKKG